jgi:hypothetical protein
VSFIDNLENNLKALENLEQKDPERLKRDQERREAEREAALKAAPHAEALRNSAFTAELLKQCRVVGHGQRVLVQFAWIGDVLRLDARAKRMELQPTAEGIVAVFSENGAETARLPVQPQNDGAETLVKRWLLG